MSDTLTTRQRYIILSNLAAIASNPKIPPKERQEAKELWTTLCEAWDFMNLVDRPDNDTD